VPQPTAGTDGGGQKRARCKWWGELTLTYRARGGGGGARLCGAAKTDQKPITNTINFHSQPHRSARRRLLKRAGREDPGILLGDPDIATLTVHTLGTQSCSDKAVGFRVLQ